MRTPRRSSKRDPRVRLAHIQQSIEAVQSYVADMNLDEFLASQMTRDAVERRIEIICEAVKALLLLVPDLSDRYPEIPWTDIKGMRDKLVHDYDDVNVDILWNTARHELLPLKRVVDRLLIDDNE